VQQFVMMRDGCGVQILEALEIRKAVLGIGPV
jgi:hypothetical protein